MPPDVEVVVTRNQLPNRPMTLFIELLAHERDGKSIPSGHFRRGEPGHAPYSKNAGFYNP